MNESWEFDSAISELYPLLQSEHPCWTVLIFASIFTILANVGILLNFSVLYVTIRTKSLRGTTNILLAIYSLCEIIHLSANFVFTYAAFSGNYFIPFKSANCLAVIPFYAFVFGMYLMLFTGIDRLFVVLFPLKRVNNQIFLTIAFTISGLSGFGMTIYYLIYTDGQLNSIKVLGSYFEIIRISFKLRLQTQTRPNSTIDLNQIIGILVGISSSSNGPILYFTSSEYWMAYRKEFTFFFKTLSSSSVVAPQP
uniref:G-protein coupled receptors family 1 profile domain-containing protein n=1 Tax=Globodera rostochiensis TaxID=31243 RepID=A0A914I0B1_GLORO